jgi:hypothetical protein
VRAISIALMLAACGSPVTGAECRQGLALCSDRCVDLRSDPDHCGACDNACAEAQACVLGMCVLAPPDGSIGDAGRGEAGVPDAGVDASTHDGGPKIDGGEDAGHDASFYDAGPGPDAGMSDGGVIVPSCDLGELRCGELCVRPDSSPLHCGGCGIECDAGEVCAGGTCEDSCSLPRMICGDVCVDPERDPDHCGDCGVACPSGVCIDGECAAPLAGHQVLVGHDYTDSRAGMNRIAGNAVFLGRGSPVRVLVYEGTATVESIDGTDEAIDQVATATGRAWTRTAASSAEEVPLLLADADVFVIYAQAGSLEEELFGLGREWERALATFLRAGGVVVLFDGESALNMGTHRILVYADLLIADGRTDVSRSLLDVVAPGDAVALGVPLRYRGESSTVRFDTTEDTTVVSDGTGPVVVHMTVLP